MKVDRVRWGGWSKSLGKTVGPTKVAESDWSCCSTFPGGAGKRQQKKKILSGRRQASWWRKKRRKKGPVPAQVRGTLGRRLASTEEATVQGKGRSTRGGKWPNRCKQVPEKRGGDYGGRKRTMFVLCERRAIMDPIEVSGAGVNEHKQLRARANGSRGEKSPNDWRKATGPAKTEKGMRSGTGVKADRVCPGGQKKKEGSWVGWGRLNCRRS